MLSARRQLTGVAARSAELLAALLPISAIVYALQILPAFGIVIYKEQFLIGFLTLSLILTFLLVPARRSPDRASADSVPWYDLVLIVCAAVAGGYTALWYHVLLPEIGLLTADKVAVSVVGIVLLLEATRRIAGNTMLAIGLAALAYAYFGHFLTGLLETRVIRFDRLMLYNYMGQDAVHGTPLFVAATIVTAFMLFGQMLFAVGAGQAISDLGFALLGRRRGGPAKVSVVASALFGSLSGSASANVATTGMITIPMIKQAGYAPHKAAAIEAVASTGGLILPPIMAATGFIMAEFLGIPYAEVAVAALLPALLFYLCVFVQVDLEAARSGMSLGDGHARLPLGQACKAALPVSVPVLVLLYALFGRYQSAETAAFLAAAATVLVSLCLPALRRKLGEYCAVLVSTGEAIVYIAIVCAIAGLVMGCLGLSGLAGTLSLALVELAQGQIWVLLALAALASIVLGMGVPVTATYVILVILVGPALTQLGVPALAAHMFVFYFGTLSFLTPPVCISVFVAAALADASPMKTAFFAMRLAAVAYVLPFFFVFEPGYLLDDTPFAILNVVVGSVCGVLLLSAGLAGFFVVRLSAMSRLIFTGAGLACLAFGTDGWFYAGIAWAALGAVYAFLRRQRRVLAERMSPAAG